MSGPIGHFQVWCSILQSQFRVYSPALTFQVTPPEILPLVQPPELDLSPLSQKTARGVTEGTVFDENFQKISDKNHHLKLVELFRGDLGAEAGLL